MFQTLWKERQIDQLHKHTYLCVWLIIFDQLMRGGMALVYQRKCSSRICSLSILHWPPNFSTKDFHMISHRFTHAAINSVLHWLVVYQEFLNATIVSQTGCLIFLGFLHFLGSKRVPWGDTLQMLLFANGKYKFKFKQIYFEIWTNIMCILNKYERVPGGDALLMQMLLCANGLRDNIFLVCIKFPLKWRCQWSKKTSSS